MEKFNLYELNNSPINEGSASASHSLLHEKEFDVTNDQDSPRLLNYYENKSIQHTNPTSLSVYYKQEPQFDFAYEDEEEYNNFISTGRNLPKEFSNPLLQTNYFEDEYSDIYSENSIRGIKAHSIIYLQDYIIYAYI